MNTYGLTDLGYKIFLDRYALKDPTRKSLQLGDIVVVTTDPNTNQREIGQVLEVAEKIIVQLPDGSIVFKTLLELDVFLETKPSEVWDRVAKGAALAEVTEKDRAFYAERFREILEDFKFVPAGRILTTIGTDQQLTPYNCFVLNSPHDSRQGIMKTLTEMIEIMSKGGGVGINVSSLRPKRAYVRGVNGRSSGAVSWGALYSFATGLIEQGGCFSGDTRISTDKGLIQAKELYTRMLDGEQFEASTHLGYKKIVDKFDNGLQKLYKIKTFKGNEIYVTQSHQMSVLNSSGELDLKTVKELEVGDQVLLQVGLGNISEEPKLENYEHIKSRYATQLVETIHLPLYMNPELAYILGTMYGDGYVTKKAVKIAVGHRDKGVKERLVQYIKNQFNYDAVIEDGDGAVDNIAIHSVIILNWLFKNNILKQKSAFIHVPEIIFQSSSDSMKAFIGGYFEADGSDRGSKGGLGFDSISLQMLQDVQLLLSYNGIISHITVQRRGKGLQKNWKDLYRLVVSGYAFKEVFYNAIPALKLKNKNTIKDYANHYPSSMIKRNTNIRQKHLKKVWDSTASNISYSTYGRVVGEMILDKNVEIDTLSVLNYLPVEIVEITPVEIAETYDFEVEDVHLLSGNGFYTSNSRRGALLLALNDWHPDVFDFINSKRESGQITNANISVAISDKFMQAVEHDENWILRFPDTTYSQYDTEWTGDIESWEEKDYPVIVYQTVKAADLWDALISSAWASAEPGMLFLERANKDSNSYYYPQDLGKLICSNPCGEQKLPANAVCNLGAINLAKIPILSVSANEKLDINWADLEYIIQYAVRFLDNIASIAHYPTPDTQYQQQNERRVGLNTMGLAELLITLQLKYGSEESLEFIDKLYTAIRDTAYLTSIHLAKEKGAFKYCIPEFFIESGYAKRLPESIRLEILQHGIRNVTLLTQAPNGTIGTMVGTSTGIEPFFSWSYFRKSRLGIHEEKIRLVEDWLQENPGRDLPEYFVTAMSLTPEEHVQVQARIQKYVDSAISKTVNVPHEFTIEDTKKLYELMYNLGCKGGTIYRDGSRDEQVLMLTLEETSDSTCPSCQLNSLVHESGCENCTSCGYSACSL